MPLMYPSITRKSDNKVFYFRDEDSRDEFLEIYEDEYEFINPQYVFEIPFGEEVFDLDPGRAEFEDLMQRLGQSTEQYTTNDIYNVDINNDYNKTEDRLKEFRKLAKKAYTMENDELIELDDNPDEISIRKARLAQNRLFQAFYDDISDKEKQLVAQVFKEHNLDIDKLDEYFDQILNMNIDVYLQEYDSQKEADKAFNKYKKTDDYKFLKNINNAISKSFEKVHETFMHKSINEI